MKLLCIIPARGGSKGVPRKNVRSVGGKPLIAWSIEAAQQSKRVTNFYVSTDDQEIAQVSKQYQAEVLNRPPEIAGDKTPMVDVILHALQECESQDSTTFDYILLLQPTAPMRIGSDIDEAIDLLVSSEADSVVSVYQVEDAHPSRMYQIHDGLLEAFCEEPAGSLRQDLPAVYHRNGAIYACSRRLLVEEQTLWGGRMVPYVMPKKRSANIDDETDLEFADFMLSRNSETGVQH